MNLEKSFEIIFAIYNRRPFLDEEGQLTAIPDEIDSLISAVELYERSVYQHFNQISYTLQRQFLKKTCDFILSIPLEEFTEHVRRLEYASREIILRTLDKIFEEDLDKEELCNYSAVFCQ